MLFKNRALGLEIFQSGFCWVMASGAASIPRIERYETVSSAEDILKPSIKDLNIIDSQALGRAIKESYNRLATSVTRLSLSIPDTAGRVMMLEMDAPMKNKEEGVDQIKWKLKKSFPLDMSTIHLDYQVLRNTESGGSSLLVALVSRAIINEYEELLLAAGLEPATVDFSVFNLYRLFASRLEIEEQLTFVVSFRGSLAVMVFQDGVIDFFRSKQITTALSDPARLYREVNSSLLVYSDTKGGWKPQKLYYYAPPDTRTPFRDVIFEVTGAEPIMVDTDFLISSSLQKIDRPTLSGVLGALGAASRGLA